MFQWTVDRPPAASTIHFERCLFENKSTGVTIINPQMDCKPNSGDLPFIKWHVWFTTVPFIPLLILKLIILNDGFSIEEKKEKSTLFWLEKRRYLNPDKGLKNTAVNRTSYLANMGSLKLCQGLWIREGVWVGVEVQEKEWSRSPGVGVQE